GSASARAVRHAAHGASGHALALGTAGARGDPPREHAKRRHLRRDVGGDRAADEGRRRRVGGRLARAVHGGQRAAGPQADRRRDPRDRSRELPQGECGRGTAENTALRRVKGLLAAQVPVCLNFTATERGPSPSANKVIAPANSRPSSSKLPPRGSCTARIATTISIAMHTAQIRVNRPSSTHTAPIVSTTMRITAPMVANGTPTLCRNPATPVIPV